MSITEQAQSELKRSSIPEDEQAALLQILSIFFKHWDSGGAVAAMSPVLTRLIAGQPLSPLTGADDEWIDRAPEMGRPMWQNMRCSSVFKNEHGTAWDLDHPTQNYETRPIAFPYEPVTAHPEMPVVEM